MGNQASERMKHQAAALDTPNQLRLRRTGKVKDMRHALAPPVPSSRPQQLAGEGAERGRIRCGGRELVSDHEGLPALSRARESQQRAPVVVRLEQTRGHIIPLTGSDSLSFLISVRHNILKF